MDFQVDSFGFEASNGHCVYTFVDITERTQSDFSFSTSSGTSLNKTCKTIKLIQRLVQLKLEAFTIKQLLCP